MKSCKSVVETTVIEVLNRKHGAKVSTVSTVNANVKELLRFRQMFLERERLKESSAAAVTGKQNGISGTTLSVQSQVCIKRR